MAQKSSAQEDFIDQMVARKYALNTKLDRISLLIDWSRFQKHIAAIFPSTTGRPAFSALVLFRSMLIQTWYNLSDYGLEETLDDRLSFRRFVGLSIGENAPDHSTICRFRERLTALGLTDRLFRELNKQMEQKGLLVKKGTLVDATLIEAAVQSPDQNEDGSAGTSSLDEDAKWTKQGKKRSFGYKGHVGIDMESGIVRKASLSSGNVYDGHRLEEMVSGDEEWVFADKAYESQSNRDFLQKKGINDGLMSRPTAGYKLQEEERLLNRAIAKYRSAVERFFGTLKRSYGYRRVRYRGLRKNHGNFMILCMAFNMKKMAKLCG